MEKQGTTTLGMDDPIGWKDLTQRKIIRGVVSAVNGMGLPQPVHLHARPAGTAGELGGFLRNDKGFGKSTGSSHAIFNSMLTVFWIAKGGYTSAAERVVKAIESHKKLTFDVGQVILGPAMAITADTSSLDSFAEYDPLVPGLVVSWRGREG